MQINNYDASDCAPGEQHEAGGEAAHGLNVHAGLVGVLGLVAHLLLQLLDAAPRQSLDLVLQDALGHATNLFFLLEPCYHPIRSLEVEDKRENIEKIEFKVQ